MRSNHRVGGNESRTGERSLPRGVAGVSVRHDTVSARVRWAECPSRGDDLCERYRGCHITVRPPDVRVGPAGGARVSAGDDSLGGGVDVVSRAPQFDGVHAESPCGYAASVWLPNLLATTFLSTSSVCCASSGSRAPQYRREDLAGHPDLWSAVTGKDLACYAATDLTDLRAATDRGLQHIRRNATLVNPAVVIPRPHRTPHPGNLIKKDLWATGSGSVDHRGRQVPHQIRRRGAQCLAPSRPAGSMR